MTTAKDFARGVRDMQSKRERMGKGCDGCKYLERASTSSPCKECLAVYGLTMADDSPQWQSKESEEG